MVLTNSGVDRSPATTYGVDYERRDIDVSSKIAQLMPDITPFLTILMKAKKQTTTSSQFIWYEDEPEDWWTTLSGSYVAGDTTISVNKASIFSPKDLVKNTATGEVMFVNSVDTAGGTITVTREYGYDADWSTGTQAADSSTASDNLLKLGNAMEENSLSPESRIKQPNKEWNLIQTFRTPFEGSFDNEKEAKKTNESPRTRARRRKARQHRLEIERQLMFGERMDHSDEERRTTGGLTQFIKENVYDVGAENGGTLTEAQFMNYLEELFQWGSDSKLFIGSLSILRIINDFAKDHLELAPTDDTYGLNLKRYLTPFDTELYLSSSKLFKYDYSGFGMGLDLDNINYKVFAGRDSTLRTNIQEPDRDGWKDEYMTKAGLKLEQEKTHGIITGVTG